MLNTPQQGSYRSSGLKNPAGNSAWCTGAVPLFTLPVRAPSSCSLLTEESGEQAAVPVWFCPVQPFTVRTSMQLKSQSSLANFITQRTWNMNRKYPVSKISGNTHFGRAKSASWFPQYLFPFKGNNQWAQALSNCVTADPLLEQQCSSTRISALDRVVSIFSVYFLKPSPSSGYARLPGHAKSCKSLQLCHTYLKLLQ